MKIIKWFWLLFDGKKRILGDLLINLPIFAGNPALYDATMVALSDPSAQNLTTALGHWLLTGGSVHAVLKMIRNK